MIEQFPLAQAFVLAVGLTIVTLVLLKAIYVWTGPHELI